MSNPIGEYSAAPVLLTDGQRHSLLLAADGSLKVTVVGGGGGGGGTVDTIVAGDGVTVDATDPANPEISITGLTATGTSLITAANGAAALSAIGAAAATATVNLTGNQTVAGTKTFSSIPVGPASNPTTANQLTRKAYVDSLTLGSPAHDITGSTTINAANHDGGRWQITPAASSTITFADDLPAGTEAVVVSLGGFVVTIATDTDSLQPLPTTKAATIGVGGGVVTFRKTGSTAAVVFGALDDA